MTTVSLLRKELLEMLSPVVGDREATAMMRLIVGDVLGLSPVDIALGASRLVEPETVVRCRDMARRVVDGEPLQYVLGYSDFMGMRLKVSRDVLIPRPETAMLVDIISDDYGGRRDLSVLDIGTGSGCIAIALARVLPFAEVTGIDISEKALAIARENATSTKAKVNFRHGDILNDKLELLGGFDIIVSNPPYIAERERADMDARVYEHEPAGALFVPDEDPLLFYRAIGRYACDALKPGGALYFEINPLFAADLRVMLSGMGWDVELIRDYREKIRFARCRR